MAGAEWHPASGAREGDRVDNSVLGLPPELAVLGGPIAKKALGAAGSAASGIAGKVGSAAKAAGPIMTYEVAKTAMQHMGVPAELAGIIAAMIGGGRPTAPARPRAPRAPKAQTASPGQAPAPAGPSSTPAPVPTVQNSAASAAAPSPAAPAPPAPPVAAAPPSAKPAPRGRVKNPGPKNTPAATAKASAPGSSLTPEEEKEAAKLLAQGIPVDKVLKRITLSRQLTGQLGTPSPDAMRQAIDKRNATGRWDEQ
jgi:hypothetical protein